MVIEMYGVVGAGIASGSGGEHTIGTVGTGSLSDRVAVLKTRTWEMMNKAAVKAVSYFVVIIATRQSIILAKLRYLYYGLWIAIWLLAYPCACCSIPVFEPVRYLK